MSPLQDAVAAAYDGYSQGMITSIVVQGEVLENVILWDVRNLIIVGPGVVKGRIEVHRGAGVTLQNIAVTEGVVIIGTIGVSLLGLKTNADVKLMAGVILERNPDPFRILTST